MEPSQEGSSADTPSLVPGDWPCISCLQGSEVIKGGFAPAALWSLVRAAAGRHPPPPAGGSLNGAGLCPRHRKAPEFGPEGKASSCGHSSFSFFHGLFTGSEKELRAGMTLISPGLRCGAAEGLGGLLPQGPQEGFQAFIVFPLRASLTTARLFPGQKTPHPVTECVPPAGEGQGCRAQGSLCSNGAKVKALGENAQKPVFRAGGWVRGWEGGGQLCRDGAAQGGRPRALSPGSAAWAVTRDGGFPAVSPAPPAHKKCVWIASHMALEGHPQRTRSL